LKREYKQKTGKNRRFLDNRNCEAHENMIYLISTRKVNGENGGYMNDKFFDLKKEKQDYTF